MWIWVRKMFGGKAEETKEDRMTKIQRNLVNHKSSNVKTLAKTAAYRKAHPRKAKRLINSYRSDFPDYYDDDDLLFMIMMYMFIYDDFGDYSDMYTEIDTMPEESYAADWPPEPPEDYDSSAEEAYSPEETVTETEDLSGSADSLVDDDIAVVETSYTPEPSYTPDYDSGGGSDYDSGGSDFGD